MKKIYLLLGLSLMVLTVACHSKGELKNDTTYPEIEQTVRLGEKQEAVVEETIKDPYVDYMSTMGLEEKVGQMLLARCIDSNDFESIKQYHLGGYILFKKDFEEKTEAEVKEMIASFKGASELPFVIAVDEEGGTVVRVSSHEALAPHPFESPQALDAKGGLMRIGEDATQKAQLLLDLGITLNLAPVADLSESPLDYIYPRTFGKSAKETAEFVEVVVRRTQEEGLAATLKHFPGYGGNSDTHTGIVRDERPYEQFVEVDYLPFKAGIEAGVACVLVSHNIVEALDDTLPASLSPKVHEELREVLGFEGIIITDDLEMGGIQQFVHGVHPAVQAVLAGNDLIIVTNFAEAHQEIVKAVQEELIPEQYIDEAVVRLLKWKS